MNEQLRKKVIADIHCTGFGAEMQAMRTFRENGWLALGSRTYFDRDRRQSREIDLRATLATLTTQPSAFCTFELVVEVKKTKYPWVVFRSSHVPSISAMSAGISSLIVRSQVPQEAPSLNSLTESSISAVDGWVGTGIHEAFRKPGQRSRWYGAFITACKAAEDVAGQYAGPHGDMRTFVLVQPLVILDGVLLRTELSGSETVVEEVPRATLPFEFATSAYRRSRYSVDIVRLQDLTGYLELAKRRADALNANVLESLQAKG